MDRVARASLITEPVAPERRNLGKGGVSTK